MLLFPSQSKTVFKKKYSYFLNYTYLALIPPTYCSLIFYLPLHGTGPAKVNNGLVDPISLGLLGALTMPFHANIPHTTLAFPSSLPFPGSPALPCTLNKESRLLTLTLHGWLYLFLWLKLPMHLWLPCCFFLHDF